MKNWRPDNWPKIRLKAMNDLVARKHPQFDDDYVEAGAGAILECLSSQKHQDWLATPEGESCSGKWVFIPSDDTD